MKLTVKSVHKSFGDNAVLRGVDLEVHGGEVLGLVGENGAGKSTLTRVVSGVYQPDSGSLSIDDAPVTFHRPQDAMARGIQVIYQEFRQNLFPQLSVAENLFVREEGSSHGRLLVSKRRLARSAERLLKQIGIDVDPGTPVGRLSVAQQQMVEIAKAIGHNLELLILDEPTAALDDRESERLFAEVRRLREAGTAVVYISHRLDEVFALADRVVVLRDGQVALQSRTADVAPGAVVAAMVGRTVDDFYPKERNVRDTPAVLSVAGFSCPGKFEGVAFDVQPGEVLGLAGVLGSGRENVLRALFGLEPASYGTVAIAGRKVEIGAPAAAIRSGIGYVVPDRGESGLFTQRPVSENISLADLPRMTNWTGFVDRSLEREAVDTLVDELKIRAVSTSSIVGELSGGNQQKVLFGKWLQTSPKVLLMDEPTRGVDVGAKAEIYRIINDLTRSGVAVVMVSSDLPELVSMSDRVLVMRAGHIVAQLLNGEINQENILTHALEVTS